LENIQYTPAPDIIHESAGHAPIIANPDYAEYLRRLGAIGSKAILSKHDIDLYEGIRKLSILKEAKGTPQTDIDAAEVHILDLQNQKVELSEMAKIKNLQWWTVEYGLIGDIANPKIYGAGLLSSIGESTLCFEEKVKKIPFSIDAIYQDFDVTQPQPQLYVTPDFSYLMQVLEEFSNTLSLRKGGSRGLQRLIDSQMVGTIELSTGLQVSGKFTRAILNEDQKVVYFETKGPTALAFRDKELIGHGVEYHQNGFSSPLGKLKNINLAIENMGPVDLKAYNFYDGKWLSFEFESGIKVDGLNVTGIRNIQGKLMLIQLKDCTVSYKDEVLFSPEFGMYDMVVGKDIISAYAGPADNNSFPNLYHESKTKTVKVKTTESTKALEKLYQKLSDYRNNKTYDEALLTEIFETSNSNYSNEWLLLLEIFEISKDESLIADILKQLERIKSTHPHLISLIDDGLKLF
jgi:phenylalanine-4-hydroxylase